MGERGGARIGLIPFLCNLERREEERQQKIFPRLPKGRLEKAAGKKTKIGEFICLSISNGRNTVGFDFPLGLGKLSKESGSGFISLRHLVSLSEK